METNRRRSFIRTQSKNGKRVPPNWTGFRDKTLWNWLDLFSKLAIPLVVLVATIGFGWWQVHLADVQHQSDQRLADEQHRNDLQIAATRYANDQQLAIDQQQDIMLRACMDDLKALMLSSGLSTSKPNDEVRVIARAEVLSALRQLNGERRGALVRFLSEATLITGSENGVIIDLSFANLTDADLSGIDLRGSDLFLANLTNANLGSAYLVGAFLLNANLTGADFVDADLTDANLVGADLTDAHLNFAHLTDAHLNFATLKNTKLDYANLSGSDLRGIDLSSANFNSRTTLIGARYNTKLITGNLQEGIWAKIAQKILILPKELQAHLLKTYQEISGGIMVVTPTQWPEGFDPKAAGAKEDNTLP